DAPWAMTFLPDGRALITEMAGTLRLYDVINDSTGTISGVPEVVHAGQGGLGDVLLHPQFGDNQYIYLSYAEEADGGIGAPVARARPVLDDQRGGAQQDVQVCWRQTPKLKATGRFGHRPAFDGDGMLWISSSERRACDPSQDMKSNLGKIVRQTDDGRV